MTKIHFTAIRAGFIGISLSLLAMPVLATEADWETSVDLQASYGSYSKSKSRDNISSVGLMVAANYLDRGGYSMGVSQSTVAFKTTPNISQQSYFLSGRLNSHFDALPGTVTFRLDGHYISNNDASANSDGVRVIAPQLSFTNYDKSFYLDLGYARSVYKNNLNLDQLTPTLGFAFNNQSDWLQLRGYFISSSNSLRSQNKSTTSAAEIKWMHWFAPGNIINLHQLQLTAMGGERIYAVDQDGALVYNLADVQRGAASLGLQWQLSESTKILLIGGQESYLDNVINNSYNSRFIYGDLSFIW